MKKFILPALGLVTLAALTSCGGQSKNPGTYTISDENAFYSTYIKDVVANTDKIAFSDTAINDEVINKAETGYTAKHTDHFEVFLPADVNASKLVSYSYLEGYKSAKLTRVNSNYAATYALSSSEYSEVISILKTEESLPFQTKQSSSIEFPAGYDNVDKSARYSAVVYVPVKVVYVDWYKDSKTKQYTTAKSLSYVLAPIYSSATTKDSVTGVYADTNVNGLNEVKFTIKNGAIL